VATGRLLGLLGDGSATTPQPGSLPLDTIRTLNSKACAELQKIVEESSPGYEADHLIAAKELLNQPQA